MAWTAPKTDWTSVDGVGDGDLNEIGNNLVYLKEHADKTDAPVHGSTSAETASKLPISFSLNECHNEIVQASSNPGSSISRACSVSRGSSTTVGAIVIS